MFFEDSLVESLLIFVHMSVYMCITFRKLVYRPLMILLGDVPCYELCRGETAFLFVD